MSNVPVPEFRDRLAAETVVAMREDLDHMAHRVSILPEGYVLADMEKFEDAPRHFRGTFATSDIAAFSSYLDAYAKEDPHAFIDPDKMTARVIFDHGSPTYPNWRHHVATLTPKPAPEYADLCKLAERAALTQRDLLDFIADWHPRLAFAGADRAEITAGMAAGRIQKLEAVATLTTVSEEAETAQARSLTERRAVTSAPPADLLLTTTGYRGLTDRTLTARLAYVAGKDGKTEIRLRLVAHEQFRLDVAAEFAGRIEASAALEPSRVFIGTFSG